MKRLRNWLAAAGCAIVVSALVGCAGGRTIAIGALISLTAPNGAVVPDGVGVRDGLKLAVDELNARGGINGRKLELVIEDCKSNAGEGKAAFQKIEQARRPLFYVSTQSSVAIAVAPLAGEKQVVLLGLVTTAPQLTKANEWVYRYWSTADVDAPILLSTLRNLRVKRLGILFTTDEYGKSLQEFVAKGFAAEGGSVASEQVELTQNDYRQNLSRLKDREAIFMVGLTSLMPPMLKQVREIGYQGYVLTPQGPSIPSIRVLPEANGIYLVAPLVYNRTFVYARELEQKYEAAYQKPLDQYAAVGYDTIKLVGNLLEDHETSRQGLKRQLDNGFIYTGVFGDIHVKAGQRDFLIPMVPARIVDGTVKY